MNFVLFDICLEKDFCHFILFQFAKNFLGDTCAFSFGKIGDICYLQLFYKIYRWKRTK